MRITDRVLFEYIGTVIVKDLELSIDYCTGYKRLYDNDTGITLARGTNRELYFFLRGMIAERERSKG